MSLYILKNGEKQGPYEDDQVLASLRCGLYAPDDRGWRAGMADWQPLSTIFTTEERSLPPSPQQPDEDIGMRFLVPVGRSGWAIAAGYLGLFSMILFPAPIAVIVSVIAIRNIRACRAQNKTVHGIGRAYFGLGMGVLGTVGLAVTLFGMLAGS